MMWQPKCAVKRSPMSRGSASPADEHMRSATASRVGNDGDASMPAKPVGAPKNTVGRCATKRSKQASGVGRSAIRITVAPTVSGNVNPLPSPYAKNSLAAENVTSASVSARIGLAYSSAVQYRLPCACTVPFGRPVEPDE